MKKGFVLSISIFIILISLVSITSYYQEKNYRNENDIFGINYFEKAILINDDIVMDINKILGVNISLDSNETHTIIKYKTKIPIQKNINQQLLALQKFYDSNYSLKQNTYFVTDFNALVDGKTEFFVGEIRIDYDYTNNKIAFVSSEQNTNVNQIDINVNINDSGTNKTPWDWNAAGEITVNINYQDQNASNTVNDSGKLSAYQLQEYVFEFSGPGDEFKISIGNINLNYGAMLLEENIIATDTVVEISTNFIVPATSIKTGYYDAEFNYFLNQVNFNKKIEIT